MSRKEVMLLQKKGQKKKRRGEKGEQLLKGMRHRGEGRDMKAT